MAINLVLASEDEMRAFKPIEVENAVDHASASPGKLRKGSVRTGGTFERG